MIPSILLLVAIASTVPFDQTASVSWELDGATIRASAVLDSSASDLGDHGVRVRAEANPRYGILSVLDLDILLPGRLLGVARTLEVGPELRARYDELSSQGVRFHGVLASGHITVDKLLRNDEASEVQLSFDLAFTDDEGRQRTLVGALRTAANPRDYGPRLSDPPGVEPRVGAGCGGYVEDEPRRDDTWANDDIWANNDSGGCEGDPGPSAGASGSSSDGGCEGDPEPAPGGSVSAGDGCEGGSSLRAARAHGPLLIIGMLLGLRRKRRR